MSEFFLAPMMIVIGALPMLAKSWSGLAKLALVAVVPAIILLVTVSLESSDYAIVAAAISVAPAILGTLARSLSLAARSLGHQRPYSLWIEAVFILPVVLFALNIVISAARRAMAG